MSTTKQRLNTVVAIAFDDTADLPKRERIAIVYHGLAYEYCKNKEALYAARRAHHATKVQNYIALANLKLFLSRI